MAQRECLQQLSLRRNEIGRNIADFFLLDIYLLQKLGRRIQVPGTEGHPDYQPGRWLKKLALPEHFLAWPLIMAPLVSLVQAGLGVLWSNFV